jgi:CBS domain-containing protein
MNVGEIMQTKLTIVDAETTIGEAATLMGERSVGSVIVCDDAERLVGILTERDLVRALSESHDAPARAVAEWMSKNPRTIAPATDVRDALRVMVDGGFRHLPVTEGEAVAGIVSMRDIATAMAES